MSSSQTHRPFSTLHSPDQLQIPNSQYSLHTPVQAHPEDSVASLHTPLTPRYNGEETTPFSPGYIQMECPADFATGDIPLQPINHDGAGTYSHPTSQAPSSPSLPPPLQGTPSAVSPFPPPLSPPPPSSIATPLPPATSPYGSPPASPSFPPPPTEPYAMPPPTSTTPVPATTENLTATAVSVNGGRPMLPLPIRTNGYDSRDHAGPQSPKTPVYTPGAGSGPNGGVHAPGQIAHPNQQLGEEPYHHGLCDCFSDISTCCTGYWCPCILYSRTYHRLKTAPNSNVNEFKMANTHCLAFCALGPVSWLLTMFQRTRIREKYHLEGSVGGDCAKAYCCVMCTLVQDEREVRDREDEKRRFAGPGSGVVGDMGYRRVEGMVYGRG